MHVLVAVAVAVAFVVRVVVIVIVNRYCQRSPLSAVAAQCRR